MRYEVRWSNGYWKVFDSFSYSSVEAHGLRKDAEAAADEANAQAAKRRAA